MDEIARAGWVTVVVAVDIVDRIGVGSAYSEQKSGSRAQTAFVVMAALVSFGRPGTLSITDHPFAGVDTAALVVQVEASPVPGSLSVILEVPVEAEYSRSEYGAGRSGIR